MVYENEDGTISVYGDSVIVESDQVILEYTGQSEYSIDEILLQVNDNIVHGVSLVTGLFGLIIGFMAAKEMLRIWLQ